MTQKNNQRSKLLEQRKRELSEDSIRSSYERDAHRILYCDAFRRLRHKAQVFFIPNNDHICTRLEHVLHVAAAACTVARRLELNVDLTNAIALGHDIGHAPFGHHGEKVLSAIAKDRKISSGIFQHEIHGLRVVDKLARLDREPEPGLNLTYAVRDGIISHCGEDWSTSLTPREPQDGDIDFITHKTNGSAPATDEGCVVRLIDKIVYAGRDVEDAIQANIISEEQFVSECKDIVTLLGKNNGDIINTLVTDLIRNSQKGKISLSEECGTANKCLIDWNYKNIYNHERVEKYKGRIEHGMMHLFDQLCKELPNIRNKPDSENIVHKVLLQFLKDTNYEEDERDEQVIIDFIAGMTDNFFVKSVSELFLPLPII